jgi:uncharacterized protein
MTTHVKCPTCATTIEWTKEAQWRPFCTERCRLIDLGEWIDEGKRIQGAPDWDSLSGSPDMDPYQS